MRVEPLWLSPAMAIKINVGEVERTGEPHAAKDSLLASALARPQQHWHYQDENDVLVLATLIFEGLNQNHCFVQGNKRTAWVAMVMFLELNGYELTVPDGDELGEVLTNAAIKKVSREELERHLFPWVCPLHANS